MAQGVSWMFFLLGVATAVQQSQSLTNVQFYEELKPYLKLDIAEDKLETVADDGSDVILLPGGPDDELDVAVLLKELGFTPGNASDHEVDPEIASLLGAFSRAPRKVMRKSSELGWWWHHHHHHHHHEHHHHHHHHHHHKCARRQFVQCFKRGCAACIMRTVAVKHYNHYHRFHLSMCIRVDSRPSGSFLLSFTLNGYRLLYTSNSLRRSTYKYCYHVPHLVSPASRLCAELYNISSCRRYMCARISGTVKIQGKVRSAYQNIGCFRISNTTETPASLRDDLFSDTESDDLDFEMSANERLEDTDDLPSDDLDSRSYEENENQDGSFEDSAEDDADSALRYE